MGKSSSKLKKKSRSQSITWSFRFPSLISLSNRRKMPASGPHLDIGHWLSVLGLSQYGYLFENYSGVEDLLGFSEADIRSLGVKNAAHRANIVSSLVALRNKYDKGARKAEKAAQRHSLAVDSRINHKLTESDILVVSNVIQSKSLCNIRMEATGDASADPVQLRKALEWELSLDSRDLKSHAWYHGAIPRQRAEEIVREIGQFLVRDCTSQPGNYVLTCRAPAAPLHFVISKVVIQPDTVYERVQYQFEDEPFDTVPDLITYYVGSGKPVTSASRARITTPCTRMYPLSFYASKYGLHGGGGGSQRVSPLASPLSTGGSTLHRPASQNSTHSPVHSPPITKREVPPRLPSKKQKGYGQSESNGRPVGSLMSRSSIEEKSNSADGVIQDHMVRSMGPESVATPSGHFTTHSLPRRPSCGLKSPLVPTALAATMTPRGINMSRVVSDPALSPTAERKTFGVAADGGDCVDGPPPKPSMRPLLLKLTSKDGFAETEIGDESRHLSFTDIHHYTHGSFQRVVSYHASGSDSGNGSGDSAQSSAAGDVSESATPCSTLHLRGSVGVVTKNARYACQSAGLAMSSSSTTLKAFEYDIEDTLIVPEINLNFPCCYDLENFQTLLLPTMENKPLDAKVLDCVRMRLHDTGSRILANHLTRMDLELTLGSERCPPWDDLRLGVGSCIELCALPFGQQMRLDLIERTMCLKLLVAVTILTCPVDSERAETLNKWIQVAIDTKTALGNLFGFNAVMLGLCIPQIQRLTDTWHIMRQKFTDSAFNFEAKLRPTLKSMNECTNPQAPNTTIPHLLPYLLLQDRNLDDMMVPGFSSVPPCVESNCISTWESTATDFGLGTMFSHLDTARKFTDSIPTYRRNAEIVLGDSKVDELLLDMFRTEFHLKFLWGSRGATQLTSQGDHLESYSKFEDILTVLSRNCEPPHDQYQSSAHSPAQYNPAIGTSV